MESLVKLTTELVDSITNFSILTDKDLLKTKDSDDVTVNKKENNFEEIDIKKDLEKVENYNDEGYQYKDNEENIGGVVQELLAKKASNDTSTLEMSDDKIKDYVASKVDKEKTEPIAKKLIKHEEDLRHDQIVSSPSSAIGQSILACLATFPDFSSNTFTAIIVPKYFQDSPGEMDSGKMTSGTESLSEMNAISILKDSFGVRLDGIDIPQPKKEAFETKFLNTSIKRVKPNTTITRNITLNLRLDTDLYICEFFEKASGFSRWRKEGDKSAVELFPNIFSTNLHNRDKHNTDKAMKGTFDLYIYHQVNVEKAHPIGHDHNYILYILRDLKPLGRSGNLEFKNDGANPLQASFKFVYRKCEQFSYNV